MRWENDSGEICRVSYCHCGLPALYSTGSSPYMGAAGHTGKPERSGARRGEAP